MFSLCHFVYSMANHDCFHCVTLFTLWPIMIVYTVSLCLLYGQSGLFSLCHFVYSMANQECFCFGYFMVNMSLFSVLYPILSVFLDCASFIDTSVFSHVILIFLAHLTKMACELLLSLGIRRLLAFHIWIFSSETIWPKNRTLVGNIHGRSSIKFNHFPDPLTNMAVIGNSSFCLCDFSSETIWPNKPTFYRKHL